MTEPRDSSVFLIAETTASLSLRSQRLNPLDAGQFIFSHFLSKDIISFTSRLDYVLPGNPLVSWL